MMTENTYEFYTIPEIAIMSQVSRPTVYSWCQKAKTKPGSRWLVSYMLGGQRRVSKLEWQRFLDRGKDA